MLLPSLNIQNVEIECKLVLYDLDGTLVEKKFRNTALAMARYETLINIAGKNAASLWAKLSGVNTTTFCVNDNGPLSKAPRKEDLIVATTAIWMDNINWFQAKEKATESYTLADELQTTKYKPQLIEGAIESLISLKEAGFKLGIATNGSGEGARILMESIGVDSFFDVYIGADDVNEGKPEPDMIIEACKQMKIDPSETIYVGDELVDAIAGTRAGVNTIIIVSKEPDVSQYTELVIDSGAFSLPQIGFS